MSSIVQHAPSFSPQDAQKIAADLFNVIGECEKLPSERDQNFRLKTVSEGDFVLKIANAVEPFDVLYFQNQVMARLGQGRSKQIDGVVSSPEVCRTNDNEAIATVDGNHGQTHFVRLLTYLPGKTVGFGEAA